MSFGHFRRISWKRYSHDPNTMGIRKPDVSGIWMVNLGPVFKWSRLALTVLYKKISFLYYMKIGYQKHSVFEGLVFGSPLYQTSQIPSLLNNRLFSVQYSDGKHYSMLQIEWQKECLINRMVDLSLGFRFYVLQMFQISKLQASLFNIKISRHSGLVPNLFLLMRRWRDFTIVLFQHYIQ